MNMLKELSGIWLSVFTVDTARYLVGVVLVSVVLLVLFRRWSNRRRIQQRRAGFKDIRREFLFSMLTTAVYACVGVVTYHLIRNGTLQVYGDISRYGWLYAVATLALLLVMHDTYFYWAHRAMHYRRLFRFFHRVHHLSRTPTPWAAYAFAPGEAFIMALFVPLFLFFIPTHETILFVFLGIMIVRNAQGHSGIEFHPRWWINSPLDALTTVTHHDLHHQRARGNYGLYFTWWDRLMGTELPDYKQQFLKAVGTSSVEDSQTVVTPVR